MYGMKRTNVSHDLLYIKFYVVVVKMWILCVFYSSPLSSICLEQ
jgi:hypothetical protein